MRILTATLLLVLSATRIMAEVPRVVTDIAPVQSLAAAVMGDLGAPKLLLNAVPVGLQYVIKAHFPKCNC